MIDFKALTADELLKWQDADLENAECRAVIKALFIKLNELVDVDERRKQELDLFIERLQHYDELIDNSDMRIPDLERAIQQDIYKLSF